MYMIIPKCLYIRGGGTKFEHTDSKGGWDKKKMSIWFFKVVASNQTVVSDGKLLIKSLWQWLNPRD